MFGEIVTTGLQLFGWASARKARKAEQERQRIQLGEQRRAGQLAEDDLFVQAAAANAQQRLMAEREVLANKADAEALRQGRLLSEEVDVGLATRTLAERSRRRSTFFEESV